MARVGILDRGISTSHPFSLDRLNVCATFMLPNFLMSSAHAADGCANGQGAVGKRSMAWWLGLGYK